jgi:hypothetical protein
MCLQHPFVHRCRSFLNRPPGKCRGTVRRSSILVFNDCRTVQRTAEALTIEATTVHEHHQRDDADDVAEIARLAYRRGERDPDPAPQAALTADPDNRIDPSAEEVFGAAPG